MPRPKSYDRNIAIELACKAFWANGYQSLGVRELEALTGLNQFAIRTEFGGKEGLYLEALKFYCEAAITTAMLPMVSGGIDEIIGFFENLVKNGSLISSPWGCLIVNTGIENARINSPRLESAVTRYWSTLEDHFKQATINDIEREKLRSDVVPEKLAQGLVTAVIGIHAKNRAETAQNAGQDMVTLISTYLNSLRVI